MSQYQGKLRQRCHYGTVAEIAPWIALLAASLPAPLVFWYFF